MKRISLIIIASIALRPIALYAQDKTSTLKSGYYDIEATEELNRIEQQCYQQPDVSEQVVVHAFANITQNFFNIALNPKDPANVTTNIIQMLAKIVKIGMEIMKRLPADISLEERQEGIAHIEQTMKRHIALLTETRNALR